MNPLPGTRGTLWWRALAWLALAGIFTATHWPNLELDLPMRGSDKVIHTVAFLGLALVWWPTGYTRSLAWFTLLAAAWSIVDESLQAVPVIHRHAGVPDAIANLCGISIAAMTIWAIRRDPRAPGHAMRSLAWRLLIDRPQAWMACAASAALGALVGGTVLVVAQSLLKQPIQPVHSAILGATLGIAVAIHSTGHAMLKTTEARVRSMRCCPRCGAPGEERSRCGACGATVDPIEWAEPSARTIGGVPERHWVRVALVPLVIGAAALLVILALGLAASLAKLEVLRPYLGPGVDAGMRLVLDAVALAAAGAVALWSSRRAAARVRQREGSECLACGYDVRGLAAASGVGRCTECGEAFRASVSGAPEGTVDA